MNDIFSCHESEKKEKKKKTIKPLVYHSYPNISHEQILADIILKSYRASIYHTNIITEIKSSKHTRQEVFSSDQVADISIFACKDNV